MGAVPKCTWHLKKELTIWWGALPAEDISWKYPVIQSGGSCFFCGDGFCFFKLKTFYYVKKPSTQKVWNENEWNFNSSCLCIWIMISSLLWLEKVVSCFSAHLTRLNIQVLWQKSDQKISIKRKVHLEMLRNCENSFPLCSETKTKIQEIYHLRTAILKVVGEFQIIKQESDQDKQKRHWSNERKRGLWGNYYHIFKGYNIMLGKAVGETIIASIS